MLRKHKIRTPNRSKPVPTFLTRFTSNGPLLSATVAVSLALAGYFVAWYQTRINEQYKARLVRVESQLRDFYGPLYSLTETEHRAFVEFMVSARPGQQNFWDSTNPPTKDQQTMWRRWIENVSMPNYLAMEEILRKRADLIVDDQYPEQLLDLSAHIAGYKSVVAGWKSGDLTYNVSFFPFPQTVRDHLRSRYVDLKTEQRQLLRKVLVQ